LISRYLILKELVIWDKGGLGLGAHYRQNYEYVIIATRPGSNCMWRGNGREPNILRVNRCVPRPGGHPTPKPVELMAHFIRLHSDKGSIVLDPFSGQGPTLVAAMNLNRKFIGIEIDEGHCRAAAERLTSCVVSNGQSSINTG
jgi:DNA modification methylase